MRGVFFFLTAIAVTAPAAAQTPADHVAMGEAALADSLHRGDRTPSYLADPTYIRLAAPSI